MLGVKSGLLELSSHFYSNMSGSALLEHSRLRSVSKFSSPENESSWAQHQSPATGKSVSRVQTENQNPNVADGTDNQQLENAIAEKSAEIFRWFDVC